MIAQGDFLKLLYAKSDDRKKIFSKLFHTDAYWRIQENLKRRSFEMDRVLAENERAAEQERARVILPREELKELPASGSGGADRYLGEGADRFAGDRAGGDPETDCGNL